MIPYGKQSINSADLEAVNTVLRSDWLTQGPVVPQFEQAIARRVNAEFAIAVNSATSALHIACLALDLGPGDWLWTSPITFVASANCALYCGAKVDFVDIDAKTYCMSVEALQNKLEWAKAHGCLPKIVVPVHFAGQSSDMKEIKQLALRYGFKIIEDASHAIGGHYQSTAIGSCMHSDITVFSFHPVKMITTGEGGMAVTNNNSLAQRMQRLRSHGITRDEQQMQSGPHGPWYYEQLDLGFNYRLTDFQAALGLSQLERLDQFIASRHQKATIYNESLRNLPLILPFQASDRHSAFHLYVIQIDSKQTSMSRNELFHYLRTQGVGVNVHYIPVHTQPFYQPFQLGPFIEAERYYAQAITLPLFVDLNENQQTQIVELLARAFQ